MVRPTCISPLRNVPLVSTTDLALNTAPNAVLTPVTTRRPPPADASPSVPQASEKTNSTTSSCQRYRPGVFSSIWRHISEKRMRSDCARGLHIAGPLERFNMRNCIAVRSVTIPIIPPMASTSLTICPLAIPPTAGLQLIWAILLRSMVISNVRAPIRADAEAASQPAWPAPTTITS